MENDTTKQEILEAIKDFSSRTDERFERIENTMSGMITKDELQTTLAKLETKFVTKEFLVDKLDEKFGELRADLVILTRKEDNKLGATVSLLGEKHVFTDEETKNILAMEPFPKVSV